MFRFAVFSVLVALASNNAFAQNRTIRVHRAKVTSLAWSPDGKTIASGDARGLVVLSDARTGTTRLQFSYKEAVASLAYSPDGKLLAVGRGREVRLLNTKTGAAVRVFKLSKRASKALAFSNDGHELMSVEGIAYEDETFAISVWQLPGGKTLRRWVRKDPPAGEFTAALAPHGKAVAVAAGDVELLSIATGAKLRSWEDNTEEEMPYITSLVFSPDSQFLAGGGSYFEAAGHFAAWKADSKLVFFDSFQDYASALAFSPHDRLLAVGTSYDTTYVEKPRADGGDVRLYDLKTHKLSRTLKGHKAQVNALAWSPSGKQIASASDDKTVKIWRLTR